MLRGLRRWWALPPGERGLYLRLVAGLSVIHALLATLGYVRTRACLLRHVGRVEGRLANTSDLHSAQRLAALAAIAGRRGLLSATCLRQALLVDWLLHRRGLNPILQLGVRKRDDKFDAHAWVELEGVALGQAAIEHQPFPNHGQRTPPSAGGAA